MLPLLLAMVAAVGCAPGRGPMELPPAPIEQRNRQTRRFETTDEERIIRATAALLLDLGFAIETSEESLGVVVGSRLRTAVDPNRQALSIIAAFFGLHAPYDTRQVIRVSVVTRPVADQVVTRATFQRIVWNDEGYISRREQLNDPELYVEFYDRLSRALQLEALP